jgi:gluconokinase
MNPPPDPASLPCSPFDETCGVLYFPRMLAKIRLHAEDRLWVELRDNLGKGVDGWCTGFLHVLYESLKTRVLEGGTDEEILHWCEANGRKLNDTDKLVWKHFVTKLGWNDMVSPMLAKRKAENGLTDRDDIATIGHFIDVDEGRRR